MYHLWMILFLFLFEINSEEFIVIDFILNFIEIGIHFQIVSDHEPLLPEFIGIFVFQQGDFKILIIYFI